MNTKKTMGLKYKLHHIITLVQMWFVNLLLLDYEVCRILFWNVFQLCDYLTFLCNLQLLEYSAVAFSTAQCWSLSACSISEYVTTQLSHMQYLFQEIASYYTILTVCLYNLLLLLSLARVFQIRIIRCLY